MGLFRSILKESCVFRNAKNNEYLQRDFCLSFNVFILIYFIVFILITTHQVNINLLSEYHIPTDVPKNLQT